MADIILVAVTLAFIVICIGYVNWCDRIIGPDEFGNEAEPTTDRVGDEPVRQSPDAAVTTESQIGETVEVGS